MRIIGHIKQIDMFRAATESGKIHSAYIFVGQSGIGKKLFTLKVAQMLNCQETNIKRRPCGLCSQCKKIETGTHPDFITISVLEDKSWISIEQIREMIKGLQYGSVMGGYNIRVIDEAHLIKPEAANALLKILEEPPKNTVVILITPMPKSLPQTILSRSAIVYFNIFSDAEIRDELKDFNLDEDELNFVSSLAMGSLGKAIELAKDRKFIDEYKNILADFKEGKFVNKRYERNEAVEFLNMLASQVRFRQPEKLGVVLKMRDFIRRNTNIGLTLEVLRLSL
ncbi:MAG: AAA family ATPase [Elusimicrobia bacterium]|nr:AAA family ATPase [Elusimicrobiota bacterium]